MGHVFRRSSGRGWRLRRRSMELWPQWIDKLQAHQPDLKLHQGLLQIAEDERAAERMEALAAARRRGLEMVTSADLATVWPTASHGGLHSRHDGRVDPLLLQLALRRALAGKRGAECHGGDPSGAQQQLLACASRRWRKLRSGCGALHGPELGRLAGTAGPGPTDDTVLGQALTGTTTGPTTWNNWPSVLVDQGFNLIPTARTMLLGAPWNRAIALPRIL